MSDRHLILLAEPEEAVRESLEMILIDEGFDCHSVSDTPSLLRAIDIHDSALVITDIQLIIENTANIMQGLKYYDSSPPPVLVTLSYEQIRDMLYLIEFGITEYIVKPFLFEEVLDRIQKLINKKLNTHAK